MKCRMDENFEKLERRLIDTFNDTDLERINYELSQIKDSTLCSGVGGSSVVADYAEKVLDSRNGILTRSMEPRDAIYMNLDNYKNILSCSYSGSNHGVDTTFNNSLNHYLLSSRELDREDVINLTYMCMDGEHSFISLGATLIPCAVLLNYYLDGEIEKVLNIIKEYDTLFDFGFDTVCDCYEIFSGYETSTAAKYLESTMVEAGIGIPIVHDKYGYCHGRSTITNDWENNVIYFDLGTELDKLLLEELPKYYNDIVVLSANGEDMIVDQFELLLKSIYLTKYIAESSDDKDLSDVDYCPLVKKLYRYKGSM